MCIKRDHLVKPRIVFAFVLCLALAGAALLHVLRKDGPVAGSDGSRGERKPASAAAVRAHAPAASALDLSDVGSAAGEPEVAPGDAADDRSAEESAEDPDVLDDRSTAELCRGLRIGLGAGESRETAAISEELIRRGDGAVEESAKLLDSGNRSAELAAMRILMRIGTGKAAARAIVKLYAEPFGDARNALLTVFGNVRSAVVADAVVDMLAREQRQEGVAALTGILASMEGSEVVEQLGRRIGAETDDATRALYLAALSGLSKHSNVPALEGLLSGEAGDPVSDAAVRALARAGSGQACRILADHAAASAACRQALEEVRSPYAQKTLLDIASSSMDGSVRSAAVRSLGHVRSSEITAFLRRLAQSEQDAGVRAAIVECLPAAE
jgi:HEAT repeat protein